MGYLSNKSGSVINMCKFTLSHYNYHTGYVNIQILGNITWKYLKICNSVKNGILSKRKVKLIKFELQTTNIYTNMVLTIFLL